MKHLARWAWVAVLGTALALSWWSLDALARRYGTPAVLAGMVSATFDGAALVAAELAVRRAQAADSAGAVKALMLGAVSVSAWLNYQHGALLGYPLAVRVLFAAPPVISGALFELQLRSLHRTRLRELGQVAQPLPRLGFAVWAMHPLAALKRVHAITGSRLHSVPLTVMDWAAPTSVREVPSVAPRLDAPVAIPAAPAALEPARTPEAARPIQSRAGRAAVPDELYLAGLRDLVAEAGGKVPSARQVAKLLAVGQDRARRLVAQVAADGATTDLR